MPDRRYLTGLIEIDNHEPKGALLRQGSFLAEN